MKNNELEKSINEKIKLLETLINHNESKNKILEVKDELDKLLEEYLKEE